MKSASIIHKNVVYTVNDVVGRGDYLNVSFALTFGIQTGDFLNVYHLPLLLVYRLVIF